jgi:hypothetical protein
MGNTKGIITVSSALDNQSLIPASRIFALNLLVEWIKPLANNSITHGAVAV